MTPASTTTTDSGEKSMTTQQILDRHITAFLACDIEGVLSDYANDIVFFTANGPLRGISAVRPLFEVLIAEFRQPGSRFDMKQALVDGDHAYILWQAETYANVYEMATDTFVVRDGRIVAQSFTASIRPKA
jgi:ketosteroid isomerase-like protein